MYSKIVKILHHFEEIALMTILIVMILLSCLQISLRLFFDSGLIWIDPLLRHLVVWGGLLGAMLAVSRGKHISLDISAFLLAENQVKMLKTLGQISGSVVCGVLTYASVSFLHNEMEYGGSVFLGVPSWGWNLIFPLAFAVMSLRFFLAPFVQKPAADDDTFAESGEKHDHY